MARKCSLFFLILLISFNFSIFIFAHSGRTDSKGGHYDHSTGEYHYHDGLYAGQEQSSSIGNNSQQTNSNGVTFFVVFVVFVLLFIVSKKAYKHFVNKPLYEHEILEPVAIDINKAKKSSQIRCKKICSYLQYVFYSYGAESDDSGGYLLRYDSFAKKVVYFGINYQLNCAYQGFLFSADRSGYPGGGYYVTKKNIKTADEERCYWLGPGLVFYVDHLFCQDSIKKMYVTNDALVIEVHREKSYYFPKEYSKYTLSKYNADTDYIITVTYIDGKFNVEKTFPNLINDL